MTPPRETPLPTPAHPRPRRGWIRGPSWSVLGLTAFVGFVVAFLAALAHAGPRTWWILAALLVAWAVLAAPGGVLVRIARRRLAAARRAHPDEPWLSDHRWNPAGETVSPVDRAFRTPDARTQTVTAVITVGVNAAIAATSQLPPTLLFVGLFGVPVTVWALRAWRVFGRGTARLAYAKFPFHPGERAVLRFGMAEDGATFRRAAFHLRRFAEKRAAPPIPIRSVSEQFRSTERRPPGFLPGPDQDIEIAFDVPADAGGTSLSSPLATWWALDVFGDTSAGPFSETFLLPIYDRPSGAAA